MRTFAIFEWPRCAALCSGVHDRCKQIIDIALQNCVGQANVSIYLNVRARPSQPRDRQSSHRPCAATTPGIGGGFSALWNHSQQEITPTLTTSRCPPSAASWSGVLPVNCFDLSPCVNDFGCTLHAQKPYQFRPHTKGGNPIPFLFAGFAWLPGDSPPTREGEKYVPTLMNKSIGLRRT